ncbi:unnamed protein product [Caenorhabditis brenneri]
MTPIPYLLTTTFQKPANGLSRICSTRLKQGPLLGLAHQVGIIHGFYGNQKRELCDHRAFHAPTAPSLHEPSTVLIFERILMTAAAQTRQIFFSPGRMPQCILFLPDRRILCKTDASTKVALMATRILVPAAPATEVRHSPRASAFLQVADRLRLVVVGLRRCCSSLAINDAAMLGDEDNCCCCFFGGHQHLLPPPCALTTFLNSAGLRLELIFEQILMTSTAQTPQLFFLTGQMSQCTLLLPNRRIFCKMQSSTSVALLATLIIVPETSATGVRHIPCASAYFKVADRLRLFIAGFRRCRLSLTTSDVFMIVDEDNFCDSPLLDINVIKKQPDMYSSKGSISLNSLNIEHGDSL